jgi:hypothetical protein
MTIEEAKHNQDMVNSLFDSFGKIIDPYLCDDSQRKEILNCKGTINNVFQIEVDNALRIQKIEKAMLESSFYMNKQKSKNV